jgi:hypothetical protein
MSAQGLLVPPSSGGGEVWDLTWQKLDRALPKLRGEVFPGEVKSTKEFQAKTLETEKEKDSEVQETPSET